MGLKLSPLAPAAFPVMPVVDGVRLATRACGIKYPGRTDVLMMVFDEGTTIGGVLTRSLTCSAAIDCCKKHLRSGQARAVIVNSGNSNAFTGRVGEESVARTVEATAAELGCRPEEIFVASTGVIGEPLPDQRITSALGALKADLDGDAWEAAARAIMTTDTFAKGAVRSAKIDGKTVTINGIAKGSGMIAPDMATMLSFVATDAAIPAAVLQTLISRGADQSFNAITVDSDTSTSDTLLFCATGKVDNELYLNADAPELADFVSALNDLLQDLAHQIVRDGEGATKFVTVAVTGAESDLAARRIGLTIANSPLVKTAIAGEDANWGRVVAAVGKSGERADRDKLSIAMGGVTIARDGQRVEGFDETPVAAHMKGQEIDITVDVGVGQGRATVWTCDLTHGYIDINADYRS
ncbi:bifunctional glutamate N-acetyltransferase/amino-acid acetyltransferase ArgJ [Kiloniella laminariae]|uniref:Arginine biosynthesis bifunctional protein ArgJ n=1 Tax=Kiloniella laminariae TaxID=454162 RepID=A0ABT4LM47_9PROT|nr:bifunctional glutamate N-acetyltransferase/amino-acid acetyltransferase ArgJ [Kiloniella laminariae]MCZ4282167.1 bifunctional glutamate N-acetyltransferase/amino-acid acetyltransferase ArgJ [Kiloniella laminariae]